MLIKICLSKIGDLSLILNVADIAMWEADFVEQRIKANKKFFDLLHIGSKDYVISLDNFMGRVNNHEELMQCVVSQVHRVERSFTAQVEVKGDDGIYRCVIFVGKGMAFAQKGGIGCLHGIIFDITESVAIKEKLVYQGQLINVSNKRLQQVYDLAKLVFWEYNHSAGAVVGDENFSRMFIDISGVNREIALENLFELFSSEAVIKTRKIIHNRICARDNSGIFECKTKTLAGDFKFFRNYLNFEYNRDGSIKEAYGVALDITREKEQENRLVHSSKMEALGRLSGGIAHDLNNLLGGVMGMTDLLSQRINPTDVFSQRYLGNIYKTCANGSEFMKKLLNFSHREMQAFISIDICEVINNSITILRHSLGKNIEIKLDFGVDDVRVYGDSAMLQNVFINLGVNARDAIGSENNGFFSIATSKVNFSSYLPEVIVGKLAVNQEYLKIVVSDNGVGIPEDDYDRIFESFYTTKSKGKGTGLGLVAVASTVSVHSGAILVESVMGKGTSFMIFLPVDKQFKHTLGCLNGKLAGSGKIIYAGNATATRGVYEELLKNHGYKVEFVDEYKKG